VSESETSLRFPLLWQLQKASAVELSPRIEWSGRQRDLTTPRKCRPKSVKHLFPSANSYHLNPTPFRPFSSPCQRPCIGTLSFFELGCVTRVPQYYQIFLAEIIPPRPAGFPTSPPVQELGYPPIARRIKFTRRFLALSPPNKRFPLFTGTLDERRPVS